MEWEVVWIEWTQKYLSDLLSSAPGQVFAFIGSETGLLLVVLIVLFCWNKEAGKRLGLTIAAVNTWLPMIKSIVLRLRPYMEYPDRVKARALVGKEAAEMDIVAQGYSFPSMHSASAAALSVSLAREIKKRWMWAAAMILTLLVGISRVVCGMHYPTDVLAGWAMGFAAAGIIALLEKKMKKEWVRHLILLALALPGLFYVRTQDYFTSLGLLIGFIAVIPFERRYVRFQNTKSILAMILRTLFAFGIYFVLNTLLKMPFSREFLDSGSLGALLIRTARYAVIIFVMFGIYPMVFPWYEKLACSGGALLRKHKGT